MADTNYDTLYEQMKDSANDMSTASVELRTMMTADDATDVSITGYGNKPSFSKQVKAVAQTAWTANQSAIIAQAGQTAASAASGRALILSGTSFSAKGTRWDAPTGTQIADTDCMSSQMIQVRKGDCFLINNTSMTNKYYENAIFFDTAQAFKGLICATHTFYNPGNPRYFGATAEQMVRGMLVCPADGYIIFQYSAADYTGRSVVFSVQQCSWDELAAVWSLDSSNRSVIESFKGLAYSPIFTNVQKAFSFTTQTVGSPLSFITDTDTSCTTRQPVKKGQFVHYSASAYSSRSSLVFTDASDNYLYMTQGNMDHVGANLRVSDTRQHASFNVPVAQDGFVRMETCVQGGMLAFLVVTDVEVNLSHKYLTNNQALKPFVGCGYYVGTNTTDTVGTHYSYTTKGNSGIGIQLINSDGKKALGLKTVTAQPVVLKKGNILVYKGNFQTPLLGFAGSLKGCFNSPASANSLPVSHTLISPTVLPPSRYADWRANGFPAVLPADVNPGEAHFYAEYSDFLVFLQGYEDSNGVPVFGSVRVYESLDDYRKYRDEKFIPSMTWGSGTVNATQYLAQYNQLAANSFITFNDEIAQVPKVGTYWQCRMNDYAINEPYQLFGTTMGISAAMISAPVAAATDYDKPADGKAFYYMAGIDQGTAYVAASCAMNYEATDANGAVTSRTPLKYDNLLSSFPARVVSRKAINIPGLYAMLPVYASINVNNPNSLPLQMYITADTNTIAVPVVKGGYYHGKGNCAWGGSGIPIFFSTTKGTSEEIPPVTSKKAAQSLSGITYQSVEFYYQAPTDGYILIGRVFELTGSIASDTFTNTRFSDWQDVFCTRVSPEEFNAKGVASAEKFLTVPLSPGFHINVLGYLPVDTSKTIKTEVTLQMWNGPNLLGTVNAEMGISGTGTVTDPKKGYNIKLTNSAGKKLKLKLGSMNASNKWGLKAYYLEGTNTRDQGSNSLWRAMRRTRNAFVGPTSLLNAGSVSYASNWFDRPFSTEGYPIELYVGGSYFGLYSVRTRAENPDYLMEDDNTSHIKITPDYGLHNAYASWANFDQTYWTLGTPEIDGYNEGDATIPDPTVQAAVTRFGKFFTDLGAGNITLTDAIVSQYFDRQVVVDYFVFSQVVGNRDGIRNNMSVMTWDGSVWGFYPYDLDRTAGLNWGTSALSPTDDTINQDSALNKLIAFLQADITARYKSLRTSGVLTPDAIMKFYSDQASPINPSSYEKDAEYWNVSGKDYQNMGYIYTWYKSRLAWIDTKWV